MHKFSTVSAKSLGLTVRPAKRVPTPSASLVPRFIEMVAFVASATASSSRSDNDAMSVTSWRRSDKGIDAVPPPPSGLMGVADDLCVARRRRCPCIALSLLLDLVSQAPSANVTKSRKRDTDRTIQYACGGRPAKAGTPRAWGVPACGSRTQAGAFAASC